MANEFVQPPILKDVETESNSSDIESTIDSYIEKSPITNRFRVDNPNLQPIGLQNNEKEDEDQSIRSSSPTSNMPTVVSNTTATTTPIATPNPNSHEVDFDKNDNTPSSFATARENNDQLDTDNTKPVFQPNTHGLDSNKQYLYQIDTTEHTAGSHAQTKPLDDEEFDNNSIISSYGHTDQSTSNNNNNEDLSQTPFWKYHILKFGKNLYLTTNPGLKHIYCRNAPGYYVDVKYPNEQDKLKKNGYTLIFRDINTVETIPNLSQGKFEENKGEKNEPIMIITKKSEREGGYMTLSISRLSKLHHNVIKHIHKLDIDQAPKFNGLSIPKKFDYKYIPIDQIGGHKRYNEVENFKNFELKDFNNTKWNIGSIPRVRISKMNRLKNKLNQDNPENVDDEEIFKFIGKKNIYFHQNYIEDSQHLKYRVNSNDPRKVYLQEHDNPKDFPPVLAMFRPCENKTRKRLLKSFKHLSFQQQQQQTLLDKKINHNSVDNDIAAGAEIRNYYKGGDGLYYMVNPNDDLPDDNKLGWITVYEDSKILGSRGMFDIVVGLTLAVGFDSSLDR
ncbi:hypothetical protein HYPBUDRAFT_159627 [Hyphopichia burtonii NRRL Y-1933]|uniref:Uncharacterized protein n=1 Tax=Hyphopichia burtonii NRRL Y-1933 TaxID=984485 RepID=A0A1E4RR71_9ASCO|nr:hypothetical protein HYPBUDRAFT_159627 [Hyphopichia burtonii NRRL Y-1933]ODV69794.1 hypothetical protein HYPBUDRAFT_159627 [Hyphopichia burtonii NRRL Y-1933]